MSIILSVFCLLFGGALVVTSLRSSDTSERQFPRTAAVATWKWRMAPMALGVLIVLAGVALLMFDAPGLPS